ncbi:MAG TPA: glutathione S-transferase [Gammaproteobacteria bacterium]
MTVPAQPVRLYRHPLSGHAHRVQLFLSILGIPAELIDVDLPKGEHKSPEFLAKNPFGQVPVLEDGDVVLADSNACLVYLAKRYDDSRSWYPDDPVAAAHVQRWLSVAAGELVAGPGAARIIKLLNAPLDYERAKAVSANLFGILEKTLGQREFLTGASPTIADLALYTYTAHAPEGGISLTPYPGITAWLRRIESLPGFVPMQRMPAAT